MFSYESGCCLYIVDKKVNKKIHLFVAGKIRFSIFAPIKKQMTMKHFDSPKHCMMLDHQERNRLYFFKEMR